MRKIKYLIIILIIFLVWEVKASNPVDLVCTNPKMISGGSTTCDLMVNYDKKISRLEFNYETEMNVNFTKGADSNLEISDNKVVLSFANGLEEKNIKLLNVILTNNNSNLGEKSIYLKNIRITSDDVSYSFDNIEKTINIITSGDLSNNCNLSSLTIDGTKVNNFSPTKYKYENIVVNKRTVFLDAVRSDEHASATGLGNALLKENEAKDVLVTVTAENGEKCVYTLQITYTKNAVSTTEVEKSNNNNLDNIELYNQDEKINFTFDKKKNNFNISVENNVTDLTIKAILEDTKAIFVPKFGPRDIQLEEGKNTFLIKVQAENESIKEYTLNITREKAKDGDTTLKYLMINGVEVSLDVMEFDYEIMIPKDAIKTDIKAVANSNKAKVLFENVDIKDDTVVKITVTAENGDISEYNVKIDQEKDLADDVLTTGLETESQFEKLVITGYNLKFDINQKDYTLKIDSSDDKLEIIAVPSNIDLTILNNSRLKNGSVVNVKVMDGSVVREYNITIEKDATMFTNVTCYLFFIVAVIILLLSYRYKIKKSIH